MSTTTIKNQPPATNNLTNVKEEIQTLLAPYKALDIANPLDPDFEEPKRYSDYAQIEIGDNRFRVLSEGIFGVEYWTETLDRKTRKNKKKPIRRPIAEIPALETDDWSYFYAFFVWNYTAQKIQILCTSKRGIVNGLKWSIDNPNWGDITQYDICISKDLKNPKDPKSAEYKVTPKSLTVLDREIAEKWQNSNFNRHALYMLFEGLDPFEYARMAKVQEVFNNPATA
jgi:hypothetical protein